MKTNGSMYGTSNGHVGTLIPSDYGPLAQYFVKFIQAYQAQGVPIYAITPQNEPGYAPDNYPGMLLPASDESNFIKNYLSPALNQANLHPRLIPYDHNWDNPNYAKTLLGDPTTNRDIAGISWHCYAGSSTVMSAIHSLYPTKDVYETECATGASVTPISTSDLLMQSVQNWAKAVELWNIALEANAEPGKPWVNDERAHCGGPYVIAGGAAAGGSGSSVEGGSASCTGANSVVRSSDGESCCPNSHRKFHIH